MVNEMGMLDKLMQMFVGQEGEGQHLQLTDRDRQMQAGLQRMKDEGMEMGYPQRREMGRIMAKGGGFRTAPPEGGKLGQGMLTRKKLQEAVGEAKPELISHEKWNTGEEENAGKDVLNRDWGMQGEGGLLPPQVLDKPHRLREIMDRLNPAQRGMAQWILKMNPKQLRELNRKAGRGNITPEMIKSVIDKSVEI